MRRRPLPPILPLAAGILLGCPAFTDEAPAYDVVAPGPYDVGYRVTQLTYTPTGDDSERTLDLAWWYATDDTEGRVTYYQDLFRREGVLRDAAPAPLDTAPVLVFSHGLSSLPEQSAFLVEHFASHGFLVVAPSHPGSTFVEGFDFDPSSGLLRPQDIVAVLDHLEALRAEADPFVPDDTGGVVLAGHSFGGYTTLAVSGARFDVDAAEDDCDEDDLLERFYCRLVAEEDLDAFQTGFYDPRVRAGIPFTPAGARAFSDGLGDLTVPQLVMTGALDTLTPNATEGDPIWEGLVGEAHLRLDFTLADHLTFSNLCEYIGPSVPSEFASCDDDQMLVAEDSHPVIAAHALAFARRHLLGDASNDDLLDGTRVLGGAGYSVSTHRR